ncbi:CPBP family intramembrane glutamic endopeptidase [Flavobacterium aurantiibacter]|uniref:CPBP family intramembrane metalloprotease domain-containing protein n=1 Tax=Flavobacterium aurantiibacter TaxID=2023067 RepID=A0A255ZLQ1_9FLAO|nr:CPBP family intramembrane glutamic endopeptidase [Flavobacterium aurantiibacter]OYQ41570.1 CPBP family intramembrane metalloprotease domain-containing protein [Flavobacterium aurantiibacter]
MSNFFSVSNKPASEFLKYLLGSVLVIVASVIGQIPLTIAVLFQSAKDGKLGELSEDVLYKVLDSNLLLFLLLLSFLAGLGGLYFAVRYVHRLAFETIVTSRPKIDYSRIYFAFGIWSIFSIITTVAYALSDPEHYVLQFELLPFIILFLIAVPMIPIQTTLEELLFRGYLMQGFATLFKNRWLPWIFTSVIFGGLHFFNPEVDKIGPVIMFYYIGTGLFLGLITLMDEGTELALGFHAANNLCTALLVTADWTAFQTHSIFKDLSEPSAGFEIFVPLVIIFPILTFIFAKKYKWKGWREKLSGPIPQNEI